MNGLICAEVPLRNYSLTYLGTTAMANSHHKWPARSFNLSTCNFHCFADFHINCQAVYKQVSQTGTTSEWSVWNCQRNDASKAK